MLSNCRFDSCLLRELPLPASAVVGGGRCCGRDVLRVLGDLEDVLVKLLAVVRQQSCVGSS